MNKFQQECLEGYKKTQISIAYFLLFCLVHLTINSYSQTPTLISEPAPCGFEKVFENDIYPVSNTLEHIQEVGDNYLLSYQRTELSGITLDRVTIDNKGRTLRMGSRQIDLPIDLRTAIFTTFDIVYSTANDTTVILTNSDFRGQIIWEQAFPFSIMGTISNPSVTDLFFANDAYYITGTYVDVDSTITPTFINYIIKTDLEGNLISNTTYPATEFQNTFFYDIDPTGNIYLGYQTSSRTGHIFKVDPAGQVAWDIAVLGDLVSNRIESVQLNLGADINAVYVAGYKAPKAFVRKYDALTGELIWDVAVGELFSPDGDFTVQERLRGMLLTRDGGIVVGYPFTSTNDTRINGYEYGKLDQDGNAIWEKRLMDRTYQYDLFAPELETHTDCLVFTGPAFRTSRAADSLRIGIFKTTATGDLLPACTPTIPTCSADIITFNSQAEVDAFGPCERFEGSIAIAGADISNVDALSGLKEITGGLFIRETANSLVSLDGLSDLEVIGTAFLYTGTMGVGDDIISVPLTTLNGLSSLRTIGDNFMISGSNLQNISLPNLESIGGVLQLIPPSNQLEIVNFPALTSIEGSLVISGADQLIDLTGFSALSTVGEVAIANNDVLTSLSGLENLSIIGQNNLNILTIVENPQLTDCCAVFNLIDQVDSTGILIQGNGLTCANFTTLMEVCTLPDEDSFIDLELGISTPNPNPDIFSRVPLTVTISNTGNISGEDIKINLTVCGDGSSGFQSSSGLVYATTAFDASAGNYDYLQQTWTIPTLDAGESATLTITLFTLSEASINIGAFVFKASPDDIDSTPDQIRNIDFCEVDEDDEVDLVLNGIRFCDCPEEFNPVCGSDGYTYDNACEAACVGLTWEAGACTDATNTATCGEITVTTSNGTIEIVGQQGAAYFFKVHRRQPVWEYVFECNGKCGFGQTVSDLNSGTYYIDVYDKSWHLICDDIEITLGSGFQGKTNTPSARSQGQQTTTPSFQNNTLLLYPNPAKETVHITFGPMQVTTGSIYIHDKFGRLVQAYTIDQIRNQAISLATFTNGIYQVSMVVEGQVVANNKLVVIR